MSLPGFFLLLAQSVILTILGRKVVPVLMPEKKIRTILVGWLGGIGGSLIDRFTWKLGPRLFEIYWSLALGMALICILAFGLLPFFKILLKRRLD